MLLAAPLLLVLAADPAPQFARVAASINICILKEKEADLRARIKKAKADATIAGVVDLRELKGLQDDVVEQRDKIAILVAGLKRDQKKPLSCKDKAVETFWTCYSNPSELEACAEPAVAKATEIIRALEQATEQQYLADTGKL